MSFEKKLYDYEVTPPQKVWDKLSVSLNDLQLENSFKKKLEDLETTPPNIIWEKIKENLEADVSMTVPHTWYNLSEIPPVDMWKRIKEHLIEDDFDKKFSESLGTLEVSPPVGNWRKIAASIEEQSLPVVSFSKQYNKPFRYAAAAVIIGLIAWGGIKLFNIGNNSTIAGVTTEKEDTTKVLSGSPMQNSDNDISESGKAPDNSSTVPEQGMNEIQETTSVKEITQARKSRRIRYNLSASVNSTQDVHSGSEEIIADATLLQKNKRTETNSNADTTTARYLVYLNDEGSLMKISKKLADLKCIYTKEGEVSQNALAKLDRTICNDIVQCWQEKLTLAPNNFSFNPLEMADILK